MITSIESAVSNPSQQMEARNMYSTQADFNRSGTNVDTRTSTNISDVNGGQRNLNGLGDSLVKDIGRFMNKMNMLEQGNRANTGRARSGQGQNNQFSTSSSSNEGSGASKEAGSGIPEGVRAALEDAKRTNDYAAYLSATASLVQTAVSTAKRLQQG